MARGRSVVGRSGLVAPWDLSSLTKDRTQVPCIARQILNHWTGREVRHRSPLDGEREMHSDEERKRG